MPARPSKAASSAQLRPIPNPCEILNLVLGPINLDLLGLVVRTNRINIRIDAVPGPGNLLGNLLCAITGILDPQAASTREEAAALNSILALVGRRWRTASGIALAALPGCKRLRRSRQCPKQ